MAQLCNNGYKIEGEDTFLPGAKEFLESIPAQDMVVFITSRTEEYKGITEAYLRKHGVRYDYIIFNAPYGERILMNDDKPSGLKMCRAVTGERDHMEYPQLVVSGEL